MHTARGGWTNRSTRFGLLNTGTYVCVVLYVLIMIRGNLKHRNEIFLIIHSELIFRGPGIYVGFESLQLSSSTRKGLNKILNLEFNKILLSIKTKITNLIVIIYENKTGSPLRYRYVRQLIVIGTVITVDYTIILSMLRTAQIHFFVCINCLVLVFQSYE